MMNRTTIKSMTSPLQRRVSATRLKAMLVVLLFFSVLVSALAITSQPAEAKKKKRKPSAKQKASSAYPKAKQAHADARKALYAAQREMSQALAQVRSEKTANTQSIDRQGYAQAIKERRQAEEQIDFLLNQTREKLLKENKAYAQAHEQLLAAQADFERASAADPPRADIALKAMKSIKAPSLIVGDIERKTLASNGYFQTALKRLEVANEQVENERAELATQLQDDQIDPSTRATLKAAAEKVSKARLNAANKAAAVSRLAKILEPNNKITITIGTIKQKPKPKGKNKHKKK
jgi:hypothetical protein